MLSDQIEQMRAMVEDFHLKKPLSSSKKSEKSFVSLQELAQISRKPSLPPIPQIKGNKILQIIGAKTFEEIPQPKIQTQLLDLINESRPYVPLKWNDHLKRWMGHDQVTVETVLKYPGLENSPYRSKKGDPGTVLQLQEHLEFKSYIN